MARKLSTEHQIFIVQQLACFKSPTEVVEAVKEEFGFEIKRELVRHYNPEQSKDVASEWKELFDKTRAEFVRSVTAIGIAHQAYRLAELEDLAKRAKRQRNYALAGQFLEQAAKERGGLYTNKRELKVEDKRKTLADMLGLKSEEELPASKESIH